MKVKECLDYHDREDPSIKHQAMVLTQTIRDLNPAEEFKANYDTYNQETCEMYITGSRPDVIQRFTEGSIRTLVIVGKLIEGYDNRNVSVVAIVRNVAKKSKVLFSQFVGRAVRKAHTNDPVTAVIISHSKYKQKENYEQFDKVTEDENVDED